MEDLKITVIVAEGSKLNSVVELSGITDRYEAVSKANSLIAAALGLVGYGKGITLIVGDFIKGSDRIKAIKAIRTVSNLGLKESKENLELAESGLTFDIKDLTLDRANEGLALLSPYFHNVTRQYK